MKFKLDFESKRRFQVGEGEEINFRLRDIAVEPGQKVNLKKDFDPDFTGGFTDKTGAAEHLASNVERLAALQEKLYAQDVYGLLIVLQAMDAAGKDGAIRHVLSGVNPQGCQVTSFKAPSAEELDHDYLWRAAKAMPQRGMIGIFNRSYYEEVLVVRVHPELLDRQKLPKENRGKKIWKQRYKEINNFERYLTDNGFGVIKFFLNISRDEQRKRFLARIDDTNKNWKFSTADYRERQYWDDYQAAYEEMLQNTSTEWAPWFVVPNDSKWFGRLVISEVICTYLDRLNLEFPKVDDDKRADLLAIREELAKD